jgi:16S rRNA (cytosine967-C5)-methyltransferase
VTVTPARAAAFEVRAQLARGLRLDVAFARIAPRLDPRDRAFAHQLLFGASRLQGRLDHLLARRVRGGLVRLDQSVLDALRLGAYELLYMDGVPDYAARSQAVEMATGAAGRGAGGLVNAVLRRVAEDGDGPARFPDPERDPAGWLTTWGSHPRWLVERWLARWTPEEATRLVEADNRVPDLHLVPLDRTVGAAVAALAEAGIEGRAVAGTGCVRLPPGTDPVQALSVLPAVVQDPGANLVAGYADLPRGTKVADLCAAPGGKAVVLAAAGASVVVASDRSPLRMKLVRENARRAGRPLHLVAADAAHPPLRPVDAVLLDAPCTGTGTLARHPDGRWRLGPASVAEMASVQARLLEGAAGAVRPGGHLVYSTCSLEPEENEDRVEAFLRARHDFVLEPTHAVDARFLDGDGFLRVLPQDTGFDGAFAARLRRAA